jgi:uncharacterized protein
MSRNSIEVVRAGYEAFNRGDIQAVFALLHPDVELYQSTEVPWGGLYKGLAQAREFFTKLSRTIESKVATEQLVDAGDRIVEIGRTRGTAGATGKSFDVPEVHVWTFEDDKIVRFEAYIANPDMLMALQP